VSSITSLPTFAAAYLLDPAHFLLNKTGAYELPFDKLSVSEQNDAMSDIERLGGADAVTELADAQLNGFQGLNELHRRILQRCVSITEKDQDNSVKSLTAPVHKRRQLWEKVLVKMYPRLAKVAVQYLSMHATSCASERNLSVFGRLYDKFRGKLKLEKAEKVVYLYAYERVMRKRKLVVDEDEVLPFEICESDEQVDSDGEVQVVDDASTQQAGEDGVNEQEVNDK
jgi:hypothetical protein